jgi:hypothetical protein
MEVIKEIGLQLWYIFTALLFWSFVLALKDLAVQKRKELLAFGLRTGAYLLIFALIGICTIAGYVGYMYAAIKL